MEAVIFFRSISYLGCFCIISDTNLFDSFSVPEGVFIFFAHEGKRFGFSAEKARLPVVKRRALIGGNIGNR